MTSVYASTATIKEAKGTKRWLALNCANHSELAAVRLESQPRHLHHAVLAGHVYCAGHLGEEGLTWSSAGLEEKCKATRGTAGNR
eukprot:scaffold487670_cov43-Prasinocladus_malaysianus.AAC.1